MKKYIVTDASPCWTLGLPGKDQGGGGMSSDF